MLAAAVAAAAMSAQAQVIENLQPLGSVIWTTPEGRVVTVEAITANIFKVSNTAAKKAAHGLTADNADAVLKGTKGGLHAVVDEATGSVMILSPDGRGIFDSGKRQEGIRALDSDKIRDGKVGAKRFSLKQLGDGHTYFGAGERGHKLNFAGDTLVNYNRQNYGYTGTDPRISQMNITMPLLISGDGSAILFDDFAQSAMTAGETVEYTSVAPGDMAYYYVSSPDGLKGLPEELSKIIGTQPLPPLWSLGYITSKYGYKTAAEADSVVSVLKRDGYPLDGMVLDLYWYGKEQDMGRLAWEPTTWPDHAKVLKRLKDKGVNMVAISQPYVLRNGKGLDNYNYLASKGMLGKDEKGAVRDVTIWVGEGGMLDVSNPATREWLSEVYKKNTDEGMTGWWGDLGEPEVHPDSMYHYNGLTTREYHNLYGNEWSKIISDLFAKEYPDRRLMTLMRGGTTGLQRYSVFPWSTDVSRSWGGLEPQIRIMLNSGLSGLGYMSHDVGGFAIDEENPYEPELYVRWLQLGLFSPMLRTHAQATAEPFHYPDQQGIILPIIKERYRWLPYNYTLAYENAATGMPLVRPVGLYSSDPQAYANVEDEYLWGRDVLVAPVLTKGATERQVRLPEGKWVNLNDLNQIVEGDTTLTVAAPLEVIPMFARAGALLTKADYKMENTRDYTPANYTVDYYPVEGVEVTEAEVFEDNMTTPDTLRKGAYALLKHQADNSSEAIVLTANVEGSYEGMPAKRTLTFRIHNVASPNSVGATAGGKKLKAATNYNSEAKVLTVSVKNWMGKDLKITIDK